MHAHALQTVSNDVVEQIPKQILDASEAGVLQW